MRYLILEADGMADLPVSERNGRTPLQQANTPNLDLLSQRGRCGLLRTVSPPLVAASDVCNLRILGYRPGEWFTGRGPIEAASLGIALSADEIAFRANLVSVRDGLLVDHSGGGIPSSEASILIKDLAHHLEPFDMRLFPGVGYRHLLIIPSPVDPRDLVCPPPHDWIGQPASAPIRSSTKQAEAIAAQLNHLLEETHGLLSNHAVNAKRKDRGELPANMIWPWSAGRRLSLQPFQKRYGMDGAIIAAVDVIRGIGCCLGMSLIQVEGATGYPDTNYEGKADAAIQALSDYEFVLTHLEAPDEAGHRRDFDLKVRCIEDFDRRLVGRALEKIEDDVVVSVLADHRTSVELGRHTDDPVPFLIAGPGFQADGVERFDEASVRDGGYGLIENESLVDLLLNPPLL